MNSDAPPDEFAMQTPEENGRVRLVAILLFLVGGALHLLFYTGPSLPLAVSVGLIGLGMNTYVLYMILNEYDMWFYHLLTPLLGIFLGVIVISTGVGYGYVDRRFGVSFLLVVAAMVFAFTRVAEWEPRYDPSR